MTDSFDHTWSGAEWAAPGFGQSFSLAKALGPGKQGTESFVVQFQPTAPPSPPPPPSPSPSPPLSPPSPSPPPSPPPPSPSPSPPQPSYYMIESGSCGDDGLISTKSECEAAATALGLSDLVRSGVKDYSSITTPDVPPGCQIIQSYSHLPYSLYIMGGGATGSCFSGAKCICKSTPPSPPPPPSSSPP